MGKINGTQDWAKDRYDEGLQIRWDVQDNLRYPVIKQSLDLVADTLYAMILPHPVITEEGEDGHLVVSVKLRRLDSEYTLARAGGDFYRSSGLPISGEVEIHINSNIFEDENETDHPRYLSSIGDWYTLLLHESMHVLGFGTSPKFSAMRIKKRYDYFVCGKELSYDEGHWGLSFDYDNRALMSRTSLAWNLIIMPETFCALEGIGWTVR